MEQREFLRLTVFGKGHVIMGIVRAIQQLPVGLSVTDNVSEFEKELIYDEESLLEDEYV
jgi:hypothetical protein